MKLKEKTLSFFYIAAYFLPKLQSFMIFLKRFNASLFQKIFNLKSSKERKILKIHPALKKLGTHRKKCSEQTKSEFNI